MKFAFLALLFSPFLQLASATLCTTAGYPSNVATGQIYSIVQVSVSSPTVNGTTFTTSISGTVEVLSTCSFQFKGFSLANAPIGADIQVYGVAATQSFPISAQVLSGVFSNQDGPVITFDSTRFLVTNGGQGVAWTDFQSMVIFSVSSNWVIATITIPNAPVTGTSTLVAATSRTTSRSSVATTTATPTSASFGIQALTFATALSAIVALFIIV